MLRSKSETLRPLLLAARLMLCPEYLLHNCAGLLAICKFICAEPYSTREIHKIDAGGKSPLPYLLYLLLREILNLYGIKEVLVGNLITGLLKPLRNLNGILVGSARLLRNLCRAIVNRIHSAHCCHKGCSGADVGGSLLPLYMLLACLEGKSYRPLAKPVNRDAYDTSRYLPLVVILCSHKACSRTAKAHREAKTLSASNSAVRTPGSRLFKKSKRKKVAVSCYKSACSVHLLAEIRIISNLSICCRVLHNCAIALRIYLCCCVISHLYLYSKAGSSCLKHREHLREEVFVCKEHIPALLYRSAASHLEHHSHSLCRSLRIVQHRAVGEREAGKAAYHCLEDEQSLKTPLGYLCLIRSVRGVPARVLKNISYHNRKNICAIIAPAYERTHSAVLGDHLLKDREVFALRERFREVKLLL